MRRTALSTLVLLPLLVAAPAAAQPAQRPGAPADAVAASDEADALFQKGKAAFASGNTQQAYELYLSAWKLKQTHDIAGNLAQVELLLAKKRDAAEHIAFALAHFPPTVQSDRRDGLKKVLLGLRSDLGVLRIQVSVADAKVALDGTSIGSAPLAGEVFVEPGAHVVEAVLKGYKPARVPVEATKGSPKDVVLTLEVASAEPPIVPLPPTKRSPIPGAVLGAIGGAAAIAGIGFLVGSGSKGSSANTTHGEIAAAGHTCPSDPRCSGLASTSNTADTFLSAGVGLLIGAGVAGVGAATYFLWPRKSTSDALAPSLRVSPVASPSGGGVLLLGTF